MTLEPIVGCLTTTVARDRASRAWWVAAALGAIAWACTPHELPKPTTQAEASEPEPQQVDPTPVLRVEPEPRYGGGLVYQPSMATGEEHVEGRLRVHFTGALSLHSQRVWTGPTVPEFVPLTHGTQELMLLEAWSDGTEAVPGWLAVYRDPYDASTCRVQANASQNCGQTLQGFSAAGTPLWTRDLAPHAARPDHLELQDLRTADGIVYYNEACQSYSREAKGACSSLVAYDPVRDAVVWRTGHLVSNDVFVIDGPYIIAGYGFTAEPAFLHLVRRADGKVLQRERLLRAHNRIDRVSKSAWKMTLSTNAEVFLEWPDNLPDGTLRVTTPKQPNRDPVSRKPRK